MSYNYRRGFRSDPRYKKEIKERTQIEREAGQQFFENFILPEHPDAKIEDYGCDNTGEVIKDNDEKKATQASDSLIRCLAWIRKYEWKVSPYRCVTLKEDQIKNWLKNKEYVVWVVNFGKDHVKFYEMDAQTSLNVFKEHGSYGIHSGFEDKKGLRLFEGQLDNLRKRYNFKSYTID